MRWIEKTQLQGRGALLVRQCDPLSFLNGKLWLKLRNMFNLSNVFDEKMVQFEDNIIRLYMYHSIQLHTNQLTEQPKCPAGLSKSGKA